jgi:hypothetical protein
VSAAFTCQLQAKVAQQEALTWGQFRTGGVSIDRKKIECVPFAKID